MTSIDSISAPASSARWASSGPASSSLMRRATEVEMVRTAVRTRGTIATRTGDPSLARLGCLRMDLGLHAARPVASPWAPAFLLGIGLGGFLDGIVLHQVLQWHHMLTSTDAHPMTTVAGLEANTLADGLSHLATWVAVLAGTTL